MTVKEAILTKSNYLQFTENSESLINFVNSHQFINEFQFNTSDFCKRDEKVLKTIDSFIEMNEKNKENKEKCDTTIFDEQEKLLFEVTERNFDVLRISKKFEENLSEEDEEGNYHSSEYAEMSPMRNYRKKEEDPEQSPTKFFSNIRGSVSKWLIFSNSKPIFF